MTPPPPPQATFPRALQLQRTGVPVDVVGGVGDGGTEGGYRPILVRSSTPNGHPCSARQCSLAHPRGYNCPVLGTVHCTIPCCLGQPQLVFSSIISQTPADVPLAGTAAQSLSPSVLGPFLFQNGTRPASGLQMGCTCAPLVQQRWARVRRSTEDQGYQGYRWGISHERPACRCLHTEGVGS